MMCPKCSSANITADPENRLIGVVPIDYVCNACGYRAKIFPEMTLEELEGIRKKYEKKAG